MLVQASPEQGNLCMVPPHWGFYRESQLQPETFGMGHHPLERGRGRARRLRPQGRPRPAAIIGGRRGAGRYRRRRGGQAKRSIRITGPTPPARHQRPQKTLRSRPAPQRLSRHESLRLSQRRAARRGGESDELADCGRRRSIAIRPRRSSVITGCLAARLPMRRRWSATR